MDPDPYQSKKPDTYEKGQHPQHWLASEFLTSVLDLHLDSTLNYVDLLITKFLIKLMHYVHVTY
jgi:hypothetical protein